MTRGSKAQIKKMIEELHAKQQQPQQKGQAGHESSGPVKGSKGVKKAGTYRPKI